MVTQVHERRVGGNVTGLMDAESTANRPTRQASTSGGRIEGLDGLRALAVIAVLVFHLRPDILPGGFLGVDVFFVVSGFLITTLLLREMSSGRVNLAGFWKRRARRLLPAVVAVLVVTVPAAWAVNSDLLVGIGRQVLGGLTFTTNWLEISAGSSYFDTTAPQVFAHFWSLAVEEQFYLLWPLLLVAIMAATSRAETRVYIALAGVLASAVSMALLYTPGEDATRVYYGTGTHAFSLLVGVALAFWWSQPGGELTSARWRRVRDLSALAALAGLAFLMFTLRESMPVTFRGGILLAAMLSAVLIAAMLGRPGPFQRVMRIPALEWIGQRSYGIYLWHWPIIVLLTLAFPTAYGSAQHWIVLGVAVVLTVGLASASYRWLETPVRRCGFRESFAILRRGLVDAVPGRRVLTRIVIVTTALLVVVSGVAIAVAPDKTSTQAQIEAAEARLDGAGKADETSSGGSTTSQADFSMPTGEEITAFGDSLVVTSADGLENRLPGIDLRAESNRQWEAAPAVVQEALDTGVRRAVVIHFGTNAGLDDPELVRGVLDSLGPDRMIVLMNLYGTSSFIDDSNAALEDIAADYPNVIIGDWHAAASEHPDQLQADQTHPDLDGMHLYAEVVRDAFATLSQELTGQPADSDLSADES